MGFHQRILRKVGPAPLTVRLTTFFILTCFLTLPPGVWAGTTSESAADNDPISVAGRSRADRAATPAPAASITMYTDRDAWEAASPRLTTINFEGIAPAGGRADFHTAEGVTLSGVKFVSPFSASLPYFLTIFSNASAPPEAPFNWGTGDLLSGISTIEITLPGGVRSVGFESASTGSRVTGYPSTLAFEVFTGSSGVTFTLPAPLVPRLAFIGFTSDEPITRLVLNGASFLVVDNFAFGPAPAGPRAEFDICLQDDRSGDSLRFDSLTGDYRFTRCGPGGLTLAGRGRITRVGCLIRLEDGRVSATLDRCVIAPQNRGEASVKLNPVSPAFLIADDDTGNNTCVCP